jgi:hypothetical protein
MHGSAAAPPALARCSHHALLAGGCARLRRLPPRPACAADKAPARARTARAGGPSAAPRRAAPHAAAAAALQAAPSAVAAPPAADAAAESAAAADAAAAAPPPATASAAAGVAPAAVPGLKVAQLRAALEQLGAPTDGARARMLRGARAAAASRMRVCTALR